MAKIRYKKKRRGSRKKENRRLLVIIGTGLLVVLVIAGYLFYRVMNVSPTPDPVAVVESDPNNQPLHPRLIPLLDIASTHLAPVTGEQGLERPIPTDVLLLTELDFNADGQFELLSAQRRAEPVALDRNLSASGFDTVISSLVVVKNEIAILRIDEYAMRDQRNRRILNQVPAPYGYAMRVSEYQDTFDFPFTAPISILELVIIDEFGRPLSDEITLYWSPSKEQFQATNTMGAPGTW